MIYLDIILIGKYLNTMEYWMVKNGVNHKQEQKEQLFFGILLSKLIKK